MSKATKPNDLAYNQSELFKLKRQAWKKLDEAWQELCSLRYAYNSLIEHLIQEEQRLYATTQDSFSRATSSYRLGKHKKARLYSRQGRRCRNDLDKVIRERRHLVALLSAASDTHHQAKNEYWLIKFEFEQANQTLDLNYQRIMANK